MSFDQLNKAFENKVRLSVMTILMVEDAVDFATIKEELDITDGNIASHMKALEKLKYIEVEKSFVGRKPNTQYIITKLGRFEFKKHIDALTAIISKL